MTTRESLREQRFAAVRRFHESGLSKFAFARREGISVPTLTRWIQRQAEIERSLHRPVEFLPVVVRSEASRPLEVQTSSQHHMAEIGLGGGRVLKVPAGTGSRDLVAIIEALERC